MDHNRCMGANTEDDGGIEVEMEEEGIEQKEPDTDKEGDNTNQTSTQSDEELDETPITDPNEQHITQTTLQDSPPGSPVTIIPNANNPVELWVSCMTLNPLFLR